MKTILAMSLALFASMSLAAGTPVLTDATRSGSNEQSNPVLTKAATPLKSTSGAVVVTDFEKAEKLGAYAR